MRTAVALGSNLGDRLANLRDAQKKIVDLADVNAPVLSSAIYETDPVGCEPGAQKFLNAVIEFEFSGEPQTLLDDLRTIETSLGRSAEHARNVSRTIDLDLLYFGENKIENKKLKLPHPRMHSRKFVLAPLADIRPDLILPEQTKTVRELLASLDDSAKVVRSNWDWASR